MERYEDLPGTLHKILSNLTQRPFPHVPNPPGSKKRASVALVLRIRPSRNHEPPASTPTISKGDEQLGSFFSQDWVQHGSPEILFIKRVDRSGDRWSGHVALPGGRRDPEDESDLAAAIRETQEEVGLDVTSDQCIPVGNLPERIISTTWGKEVLMVICPYIFLWMSPASPQLKLQPTEIAATHWVPLAALLTPALRTQQLADFSARLSHGHGALFKALIKSLPVGKMSLSAVRLIPSESLFSTSVTDFLPSTSKATTRILMLLRSFQPFLRPLSNSSLPSSPPLQLWGLTLGILADFLDQFPPHDAVKLWTYPTFTPLDLRFFIWLVTYDKRRQNARNLNDGTMDINAPSSHGKRRPSVGEANQTAVDVTSAAIAKGDTTEVQGTIGAGRVRRNSATSSASHSTGALLDGYFDRMKIALVLFTLWRVGATATAMVWALRFWKRFKGSR